VELGVVAQPFLLLFGLCDYYWTRGCCLFGVVWFGKSLGFGWRVGQHTNQTTTQAKASKQNNNIT
jgi:hypothetical protein